MLKRTTIEIDQGLLERAKKALGQSTARATEEALRLAAEGLDSARVRRADKQRRYLQGLGKRLDAKVLSSGAMWR